MNANIFNDGNLSADSDNTGLVAWDEKYNIGIEIIDEQHKELLNLTNQLYQACLTGGETVDTVFKKTMAGMVKFVKYHFGTEQKLMERINYPWFTEHKKQHDVLIMEILMTAKEYNGNKKFVPNKFVRKLKDWIFHHIAIYDKKLGSYIIKLRQQEPFNTG